MARGRMLNRKISRDKRVADLINESVGCSGGMFWTWMVPHLDREGRIDGDPEVLKGMVAPRIKEITVKVIEKTLEAAHDLGLIDWYEANGDQWVSYPRFRENQKGLRVNREPESEIPEPPLRRQPGDSSAAVGRQDVTELSAEGKGREGKGREGKGREEKRRETLAPLAHSMSPKNGDAVACVWYHWRTRHPRAAQDLKSGMKGYKLIAARLKDGKTIEDLKTAIDGFHLDSWVGRKNFLQLKYLFGDDDLVTKFIGYAANPPSLLSEKTQRTVSAAQQWVAAKGEK